MSAVISQATAARIWHAHREVEIGKKLLASMEEELKSGRAPNPIEDRQNRLELGVPNGMGHRLLDVRPTLAIHIIRAHIADKERDLVEASIVARMELEGTVKVEVEKKQP